MLKSLGGFALLLLLTGIGLTIYLPEYKPQNSQSSGSPVSYRIEQSTISQPIDMNDLLLDTDNRENVSYGLQLGLFTQLKQAIQVAESTILLTPVTIIKAEDAQRSWYLLAMGPYGTQKEAETEKLKLPNNMKTSAFLVEWPFRVDEDSEK